VDIKLLAGFEIIGPKGPVGIASLRQRIILTLLLLEANRVVSVDRLIEAVWGDNPPSTARGQIHICISMVRRALEQAGIAPVVETDPSGYLCRIDDDAVDVLAFHRLVREGRQALEEKRLVEADRLLVAALDVWDGGAPMTGLSRTMDAISVRLVEQRVSALEVWADVRLQLGGHDHLVEQLAAAVDEFPLRERLRSKLMLALYQAGRQAEALDVYREGRSLLVEELGVEPGPELQVAEHAILTGQETLVRPAGGAGTEIARSEHDARRPQARVARTLPGDVADFTGHAAVLEDLQRCLRPHPAGLERSGVSVIMLYGRSGVGKTTIAVHAAHRHSADFPDGQLYLNLHDPSGEPVAPYTALHRLLRAVGVPADTIASDLEGRAEMFRQYVSDRRLLIVLDDAHDEQQISPLLPGTSSSSVIVTSQLCLAGIPGAHRRRVEPLAEPEALIMLARFLDADRVRDEKPAARQLVRLCTGLPLAIRVAAARLVTRPHWTIRGFVDRLSDESRRLTELNHRDLGVRAGLDRSYGKLPTTAQRLFRHLGLLGGATFGSWLAGPLLGTEYLAGEEVLETLVDANLVEVERTRAGNRLVYRLHDLAQAYARERLEIEDVPGEDLAESARVLHRWRSLAGDAMGAHLVGRVGLGRSVVPARTLRAHGMPLPS
jgi:DNA-binding SARP family transcriptional activator